MRKNFDTYPVGDNDSQVRSQRRNFLLQSILMMCWGRALTVADGASSMKSWNTVSIFIQHILKSDILISAINLRRICHLAFNIVPFSFDSRLITLWVRVHATVISSWCHRMGTVTWQSHPIENKTWLLERMPTSVWRVSTVSKKSSVSLKRLKFFWCASQMTIIKAMKARQVSQE